MNRTINPLADPDVLRQILASGCFPLDQAHDSDGDTLPLPTSNYRTAGTDKPDDGLNYEFAVGDAVDFVVRHKGEPDETLTGTITGQGTRTTGTTYAVVKVDGKPHHIRVGFRDLRPAKGNGRNRRPVANAVYRGEDCLRLPG